MVKVLLPPKNINMLVSFSFRVFLIYTLYYAMAVSGLTKYLGLGLVVLEDIEIQDENHLIETSTAETITVCFYNCTKQSDCMSFSYNSESQICRLYNAVYGSGEKGVPSTGTRHYDIGENGKLQRNNRMSPQHMHTALRNDTDARAKNYNALSGSRDSMR